MRVDTLIEKLKRVDPNRIVVMYEDGEGAYLPLHDIEECHYRAGSVIMHRDTYQPVDRGIPAIVLKGY